MLLFRVKPFRIRTSEEFARKSFRIRTYRNTGGRGQLPREELPSRRRRRCRSTRDFRRLMRLIAVQFNSLILVRPDGSLLKIPNGVEVRRVANCVPAPYVCRFASKLSRGEKGEPGLSEASRHIL